MDPEKFCIRSLQENGLYIASPAILVESFVRITPFLVVLLLKFALLFQIGETLSLNDRSQHKNMESIFRDDHGQKQPENFKLKRNGFFSSFLFTNVLPAFIVLEGNGSNTLAMLQYLSEYLYISTALSILDETTPYPC